MRPRSQRPQLPEASEAQQKARLEWNGGLSGKSRRPAVTLAVEPCTVEACGTPAVGRAPSGMVTVAGSADGAPAHRYCVGRCAVIARTRAEIRAIPMRPDGDC